MIERWVGEAKAGFPDFASQTLRKPSSETQANRILWFQRQYRHQNLPLQPGSHMTAGKILSIPLTWTQLYYSTPSFMPPHDMLRD